MDNKVKHLILATIPYAALLYVFYLQDYVEILVIAQLYLPIWSCGVCAIRGKKNWVGHVVLFSVELGLISGYVIHVMRPDWPTMAGAYLNVLMLIIGLIVGILLQIRMGNRK